MQFLSVVGLRLCLKLKDNSSIVLKVLKMWRPWSLPNLQMYDNKLLLNKSQKNSSLLKNNKYINKQSINCSYFGNICIRTTLVCNCSYMSSTY